MPLTPAGPFPGGMPLGFPPFTNSTSTPPATNAASTPPMSGRRNLAASIGREETKSVAQLDANQTGLWASTANAFSTSSTPSRTTTTPPAEATELLEIFTRALQGQQVSPTTVMQTPQEPISPTYLPVSVTCPSGTDITIKEGLVPLDKRFSSFTRDVGATISKMSCRVDQKSVQLPLRVLANIGGNIYPLLNALRKRLPLDLQNSIPLNPTNEWVAGFSSDPEDPKYSAYISLQYMMHAIDVAVMIEIASIFVNKAQENTRLADILQTLCNSLAVQEPTDKYLIGILKGGVEGTKTHRIVNQAMRLTMPVSSDSFLRELAEYGKRIRMNIIDPNFNITDFTGPLKVMFEELTIKAELVNSSEYIPIPLAPLQDQINDDGIINPLASQMVKLIAPVIKMVDTGEEASVIIEKASTIQMKIDEYWVKNQEALAKERAIAKAHAQAQAKSAATALYTQKPADSDKGKPKPKDKPPRDPAAAAMIKMCTSRSVDGRPTKDGGQHPCISWNLCIANGGSPTDAEKACTDNPRRKSGADGQCIHFHGKAQDCKLIAPPSGAEDLSNTD